MPDIGGPVAQRPLHFIFILDTSGSMSGEKIASLNEAIAEVIPHMQKVASENPFAELLVRAIRFSTGAQWVLPAPTPVEQFSWTTLAADGVTDMGKALTMVSEELKLERMGDRALPPVLVLVSDGQPTDDFGKGLTDLMAQPWGKKAVRVAIAIGADADHEPLERFIASQELKVLQANNPDQLVARIKWASTQVVQASMAPPSQPIGSHGGGNVPIPQPPPDPQTTVKVDDVW